MGEQGELALKAPVPGRREGDFYPTPREATEAILPYLTSSLVGLQGRAVSVLDPCCGEGSILDVAFHWFKAQGLAMVPHGLELDLDHARNAKLRVERLSGWASIRCEDALSGESCWPAVDLIIMNPPYKAAQPFVEKALVAMLEHGTTVAVLLRLAWMASQRRAALHEQFRADAYVLSKRPSFTGGGSDNSEYAWFVYRPGKASCGRWRVV